MDLQLLFSVKFERAFVTLDIKSIVAASRTVRLAIVGFKPCNAAFLVEYVPTCKNQKLCLPNTKIFNANLTILISVDFTIYSL